jgi:outer membrane receptor protein involved in Fe transport
LATFGFEAERGEAHYSYSSAVDLRGVLATLSPNPDRTFSATLAPRGERYAAYASDRWRITDRLIADLGLRWDEKTYLPARGDEQLGPRASLLYRLGGQTELRLSHGRFFQSQGLTDLPVEDGAIAFAPAQDAAHTVLGVNHRFPAGLALRAEVFGKTTYNARPRYENMYDPLVLLPELRPDRIQIVPDRGEARGVEMSLSVDRPLSWWFGWSLAHSDDVIDGARVARSWDQRHALSGGVTRDVGAWTLSGVADIHTGWPTTTLALVPSNAPNAVDGVVAVPGPRNAERLGPTRRLDFRASRRVAAGLGSLRVFAEVTNLTNRGNECCVRYEQVATPPGAPAELELVPQHGLPLVLNVGALWEF